MTKNEKIETIQKVRNDPNFPGAIALSLRSMLYMNQILGVNERRYYYCNEILVMVPIVIYTQKDFFLINEINNKIEVFKSAGLIEYWDFKGGDEKALNTGKYPGVLTIDHLTGSFQILILGSFISSIVFIIEILFNFFKKRSTSRVD